ncbi:MAG: cobalt ABC transporter permease [Gammaproteobacteria bacterium]|nr:MAG: cobalt ABC transporter permease [Gammaproteobacteria bacterium]
MQVNHILLSLVLGLWSVGLAAHNVVGGVYVVGSQVEGEIGFSNGDMAPANSPVIVTDADGNQIVATTTNEDGFFTFNATQRIDHYIVADLGSGHIYKYILKAEELPDSFEEMAPENNLAFAAAGAGLNTVDPVALQAIVEKAVARQIKPLRKELNAYKEKASFRDVIGGMGYILGLCGLGMWLSQRKRNDTGNV